MTTGIKAFFLALPAILELISRLGNVFDAILRYSKENNINDWISRVEEATKKLENAKTAEQKLESAHLLVGIIRDLGLK